MRNKPDAPTDRGHLVGICFFILGVGTLLPWNFFMTASVYFNKRLDTSCCNSTSPVERKYYFDNWMTLLSQLPLLLFTLLNSILYPRISEKMRIGGSLVFILIFFILTAILVKVSMDQDRFFSITMTTIWFINSFGAVLQGSMFGLVGLLPQKYSTLFMSGQGLAGTFAALAMVFAIASRADEESAALGYFITPCVGTLVTLLSYVMLYNLKFAKFYLHKNKNQNYEVENELLPKETTQDNGELKGHNTESVPNGILSDNDGAAQALDIVEVPEPSDTQSSVMEVFKKVWVMAFCVTFLFTVTLSVFPAVTVNVKTVYPGNWESYFIPVCCFLLFNLMDWTGRSVTSFVQWPPKESMLFPALVVSRVIFIPLLMLCNVQQRHFLPVLFSHDIAFVIIMILFAISSGYCVCLSMSYAPQLVAPKDAETAGALMTFFLALGLSLGAALSFGLRFLI